MSFFPAVVDALHHLKQALQRRFLLSSSGIILTDFIWFHRNEGQTEKLPSIYNLLMKLKINYYANIFLKYNI
jgi:hypothetical protein